MPNFERSSLFLKEDSMRMLDANKQVPIKIHLYIGLCIFPLIRGQFLLKRSTTLLKFFLFIILAYTDILLRNFKFRMISWPEWVCAIMHQNYYILSYFQPQSFFWVILCVFEHRLGSYIHIHYFSFLRSLQRFQAIGIFENLLFKLSFL